MEKSVDDSLFGKYVKNPKTNQETEILWLSICSSYIKIGKDKEEGVISHV